jgi:hypothetical protein
LNLQGRAGKALAGVKEYGLFQQALLNLLVQLGVLDGDRRVGGQALGQTHLI